MQATVRMALVNQFKHKLEEGRAITLQRYSLEKYSPNHAKIIMILQLAMMKMWDGKMCVQNGYHGTKLFLFDGTIPIVNEEFSNVKEYTIRLFAKQDIEKTKNMATRISTASKNSTKENFVSKIPSKNITELLDVAHGCKNKVIRSSDMVDLEADVPKKTSSGKDDWWCTKCNIVPNIKTM
ncbi:hypothetical protein Tco_1234232 [Tanacetum coccineum]